MNENLNRMESLEAVQQERLNELREQRVQELMNEADRVQDDALELLAKLDGTTVEEQREKLAEAAGEIGKDGDDQTLVLEDERLNKRKNVSFGGYTPAECARITTGTQKYCPFSGSGR